MLLNDLIKGLKGEKIVGDTDRDVKRIVYDSRQVIAKDLFVAIPGLVDDGAKFIPQAIEKGASIVVTEKDFEAPAYLTKIIVPNARIAMAELAAAFNGYPARKLKMIGITGTNGKTTTTYLIEAILRKAGHKVGVIGTVEARIAGKAVPVKLTTPESVELQELLASMVKESVTHVVMEVSSHSLELNRVHGCEFDVAIYTNLTHDHLDFHKDMLSYLKAKLKLFEKLGKGTKKDVTGIVNVDDPYGKRVMTYVDGNILTYGIINNADFRASAFDIKLDLMTFNIETFDQKFKIATQMVGVYNAYNIMAAMLCGKAFGISYDKIKEAIEEVKYVPGRFERVRVGQKFPIIVDFAHSPDSLQNLLDTVRPLVKGKVILVLGCPGNRDKAKRPIMGEIAGRLVDFTYITTDDPHNEKPITIINEIEEGIKRIGGVSRKSYLTIEDRRTAIEQALHMAHEDDIVVIAGRGHEKFQDYNGVKIEIDDREVVRDVIGKKR